MTRWEPIGRPWRRFAVMALLCVLSLTAAQTAVPKRLTPRRNKLSNYFSARVNAYAKLRASLEGTLPKLKPTDQPAKLAVDHQALSAKVIEARKNAKQGDIFTKEISEQFRQRISQQLSGQQGRESRQTIRQGDPVQLQVHVNQVIQRAFPHDGSADAVVEAAQAPQRA